MKKFVFLATAAAMLAGCSNDSFVGEDNTSPQPTSQEGAIKFSTVSKSITRADHVGADAAGLLNNNFVFAGIKGGSSTPFVFDQYTAKYVTGTANTTESNSNDWEYVNQTLATTTTLPVGATQTIKYWDYATKQYDFAAYSLGKGAGATPTYATPTAIKFDNLATNSYTLTGSVDELSAAYISDLVTAYNRDDVNDYGQPVQFRFRSLATKIRMAFYETIPGYSVKDVNFYADASTTTSSTTPTLYTSSAVLPNGSGTMTISFPTTGWANKDNTDYNKAHVSFAQESGVNGAANVNFEALANLAAAEKKETAGNVYLGRASNAATYAGGLTGTPQAGKYYTILPYETGANLTLRIKYTLVSTDGSGETITVDNATAVVPAELAKWNPNYAYTYIFKISDMTNGSTGVDGSGNVVTGLTPITLNAVVVDTEDGVQETITTVSDPSITTYTKGKVVTANDEYTTGAVIYVIVNNGTSNETLTVGTNANLYTVTIEDGAAQNITEESVNNALENGVYDGTAKTYTVTDANGKKLVVTKSTLLTASTKIEAADSPTGNEITVTGAEFTPATAGTYVFQYVKTAPVAAVYTAVANSTVLTQGQTYYTSNAGAGQFVAGGTEIADGTNYFELTTPAVKGEYQYKVIKVVAP